VSENGNHDPSRAAIEPDTAQLAAGERVWAARILFWSWVLRTAAGQIAITLAELALAAHVLKGI
jgi:hypothetical protein